MLAINNFFSVHTVSWCAEYNNATYKYMRHLSIHHHNIIIYYDNVIAREHFSHCRPFHWCIPLTNGLLCWFSCFMFFFSELIHCWKATVGFRSNDTPLTSMYCIIPLYWFETMTSVSGFLKNFIIIFQSITCWIDENGCDELYIMHKYYTWIMQIQIWYMNIRDCDAVGCGLIVY